MANKCIPCRSILHVGAKVASGTFSDSLGSWRPPPHPPNPSMTSALLTRPHVSTSLLTKSWGASSPQVASASRTLRCNPCCFSIGPFHRNMLVRQMSWTDTSQTRAHKTKLFKLKGFMPMLSFLLLNYPNLHEGKAQAGGSFLSFACGKSTPSQAGTAALNAWVLGLRFALRMGRAGLCIKKRLGQKESLNSQKTVSKQSIRRATVNTLGSIPSTPLPRKINFSI